MINRFAEVLPKPYNKQYGQLLLVLSYPYPVHQHFGLAFFN